MCRPSHLIFVRHHQGYDGFRSVARTANRFDDYGTRYDPLNHTMQMDVYLLLSWFRAAHGILVHGENVPHPALDVVVHFLGRRSHAYVIRIDRIRPTPRLTNTSLLHQLK